MAESTFLGTEKKIIWISSRKILLAFKKRRTKRCKKWNFLFLPLEKFSSRSFQLYNIIISPFLQYWSDERGCHKQVQLYVLHSIKEKSSTKRDVSYTLYYTQNSWKEIQFLWRKFEKFGKFRTYQEVDSLRINENANFSRFCCLFCHVTTANWSLLIEKLNFFDFVGENGKNSNLRHKESICKPQTTDERVDKSISIQMRMRNFHCQP